MAVVVVKDVLLFVCLAMNLEFANMVRTGMLLLPVLSAAHGAMLPYNPSHLVLLPSVLCMHVKQISFSYLGLLACWQLQRLANFVVGSIILQ